MKSKVIFRCRCGHEGVASSDPNGTEVDEAQREAQRIGWRKLQDGLWLCPFCVEENVSSLQTRREGRKDDGGKDRWDLLPMRAVAPVVKVLTFGAAKYAPDNWRKVPKPRSRYFAAALRHLAAWQGGETLDPESGLPHLAHAVCCLVFLLDFEVEP